MATMMFPILPHTDQNGDATFSCQRMNQEIQTAMCLKWFVDYNALRKTDTPCFKCPQGQKVREAFARS